MYPRYRWHIPSVSRELPQSLDCYTVTVCWVWDCQWNMNPILCLAGIIVARLSNVGILEKNQHCWRFHGSGVITAPQIIGLISFCTGMHHEYFFEVVNVLSCSPFMFENKENKTIDRWIVVHTISPARCRFQHSGLENSPQSFGVYTDSQSRSVVMSAENPAPDNSPQSIGELRNGNVANLQELYYTRLVR